MAQGGGLNPFLHLADSLRAPYSRETSEAQISAIKSADFSYNNPLVLNRHRGKKMYF